MASSCSSSSEVEDLDYSQRLKTIQDLVEASDAESDAGADMDAYVWEYYPFSLESRPLWAPGFSSRFASRGKVGGHYLDNWSPSTYNR